MLVQRGHEAALGLPQRRQFLGALVHARGQARQVGSAQGRGLHAGRAHDGNAQQVGLELHEQVVDAGAAVHAQFAHRRAAAGHRVAAHGQQQGGALEGDGFKRGPRDVGNGGAARQARDGAARIGLPVGGAQSGEGRHHHHAARVGHALGQLLHLAAVLDGAQPVAQPLDHGAAHEDAAFQRIGRRSGGLCRSGGQQAVGGGLEHAARVHEHEAARAIGVLGHAGRKAGLAEEGALLVAGHAADGDLAAQHLGCRAAEIGGGRQHLGHQRARNLQQRQQIVVPLVGVDVEQHGAAGVGDIGHMAAPARELPDQPAVHGAEGQLAALGGGARAVDVVQNPAQLGAREIGVDQQARLALDGVGMSGLAQLGAQRLGAAVLPDDGVVYGLARGAVPDHRGLALVGDAQGADVGRRQPGLGQGLARRGQLGAPDLARIVLDPAGPGIDLRQLQLGRGHDAALGVEDDAARAGGALVQGKQIGHGAVSRKSRAGARVLCGRWRSGCGKLIAPPRIALRLRAEGHRTERGARYR